MKQTIIKHSKSHLKITFLMLVVSLSLILWIESGSKESKWTMIITGIIGLGIISYVLKEMIYPKGVIIISEEGIELRNKGWNHWDYIESYSIYEQPDDESTIDYLNIRLKDGKVISKKIMGLEKNRNQILNEIKKFRPELPYHGSYS
jgi:hypothetical protein